MTMNMTTQASKSEVPHDGVGVSDAPAVTDLVGIEPYARGLAEFIAGCPSPMTIAIQGGWGTGKTSTMNMVEKALRDVDGVACDVVTFNTWQYAHTDLGEGLTFHLVSAILEASTPKGQERQRDAILASLKRGAKHVSTAAVQAAVRAADAAAAHAISIAVSHSVR